MSSTLRTARQAATWATSAGIAGSRRRVGTADVDSTPSIDGGVVSLCAVLIPRIRTAQSVNRPTPLCRFNRGPGIRHRDESGRTIGRTRCEEKLAVVMAVISKSRRQQAHVPPWAEGSRSRVVFTTSSGLQSFRSVFDLRPSSQCFGMEVHASRHRECGDPVGLGSPSPEHRQECPCHPPETDVRRGITIGTHSRRRDPIVRQSGWAATTRREASPLTVVEPRSLHPGRVAPTRHGPVRRGRPRLGGHE